MQKSRFKTTARSTFAAALWAFASAHVSAQTIIDESNLPLPDPACRARAARCANRNYHPNKLLKPPAFGTQHGSCEPADLPPPGSTGPTSSGLPVAISDAVVVGTYSPHRKRKRPGVPNPTPTRRPGRQTAYVFVVVDRCSTYGNHGVHITTQVLKIPLDATRKIMLSTRRETMTSGRR